MVFSFLTWPAFVLSGVWADARQGCKTASDEDSQKSGGQYGNLVVLWVLGASQATLTCVTVHSRHPSCSLSGQGGQDQEQAAWHPLRSIAQESGDGSSSLTPGLCSPVPGTQTSSYISSTQAHPIPSWALVQWGPGSESPSHRCSVWEAVSHGSGGLGSMNRSTLIQVLLSLVYFVTSGMTLSLCLGFPFCKMEIKTTVMSQSLCVFMML